MYCAKKPYDNINMTECHEAIIALNSKYNPQFKIYTR